MRRSEVESLIDGWRSRGIVSQDQAARMIAELHQAASEGSGNKLITTVTYLGASALSLGALLLVASNWELLSRTLKIVLALLLPVGPLCFAYWKMNIQGRGSILARSANVLGLALIGGSIALIGQVYNLAANPESFLWTWALLALPFVFVFKRAENVVFSALGIAAAVHFSLFMFVSSSDMEAGVSVLVVTVAALAYAYLAYALGSLRRRSATWCEGARYLRLSAGASAATILFITTLEWYARIVVGGDFVVDGTDNTDWVPVSIFLNLFFVGFLVFALVRAIRFEEYGFAFSVTRLFTVYLLVKYYTLFFSMMDTGLFFVIGGLLFIAGGITLERNRKLLVSYMKGSQLEKSARARNG